MNNLLQNYEKIEMAQYLKSSDCQMCSRKLLSQFDISGDSEFLTFYWLYWEPDLLPIQLTVIDPWAEVH